jgi:hypothetical protein
MKKPYNQSGQQVTLSRFETSISRIADYSDTSIPTSLEFSNKVKILNIIQQVSAEVKH